MSNLGNAPAPCQNSSEPTGSIVVNKVNIFNTGKAIEIQLVRATEVCRKVYIEKNS